MSVLLLLGSGSAWGGASSTSALFRQSGGQRTANDGDYLSASNGFDDPHFFFLEVPVGTSALHVEFYDVDIGGSEIAATGKETSGNRDEIFPVGGSGNDSQVDYSLYNPSGTLVSTVTASAGIAIGDAAWFKVWGPPGSGALVTLSALTNPTPGHWFVMVDMSSFTTGTSAGNDINAYGLRAHDGTVGSGGTEINIYVYPYFVIGAQNGFTNTYTLYPWVVAGNVVDLNDWDLNRAGDSLRVVSRVVANMFSFTTTGGAGRDNTWTSTSTTGDWSTDIAAFDYGIWTGTFIAAGTGGAGVVDMATVYLANQYAGNPPGTSLVSGTVANTIRVYLPRDGGGAPTKPYLTHNWYHVAGPNPATVGMTTTVEIAVTFVNPTPHPVEFQETFSPTTTRIVAAEVPGDEVLFARFSHVSQGSVIDNPPEGGSGLIEWDPGVVAANSSVRLKYRVDVTPTSPGQVITLTGEGLPAGSTSGTVAKYLDETDNLTNFRNLAVILVGPLRPLRLTEGAAAYPTRATIGRFGLDSAAAVPSFWWETTSEHATVGFELRRLDPGASESVPVSDSLVYATQSSEGGALYGQPDPGWQPGAQYTVVEYETDGGTREHGPYAPQEGGAPGADGGDRVEKQAARKARAAKSVRQARRATRSTVVPWARVEVRDIGLHRVTGDEIDAALGLAAGTAADAARAGQLRLSSGGSSVPYTTDDDLDGIFFHGVPADGAPANVYWIELGPGLQMAEVDSTASAAPTGAALSWATVRIEEDRQAITALVHDPAEDFWAWEVLVAGAPGGTKSFELASPHRVDDADGTLVVHLVGGSDTGVGGEHTLDVSVNGQVIGQLSFTGLGRQAMELTVPGASLVDGPNIVQLVARLGPGVPYSVIMVDALELSYFREQRLDAGVLSLELDSSSTSIGGLADDAPIILDVDDPTQPQRIVGGQRSGDLLGFGGGSGRYRVTEASAAITVPARAVTPSGLRDLTGAEYVVIAREATRAGAERLADYRRADGLTTVVVDLEDIYDEFAHGLATPEAVRAFLRHALDDWSVTPRYVVLAGDGTYERRPDADAWDNLLPAPLVGGPDGLFSSDPSLVDVDADGKPDLAVGRIPVVTSDELDAYLIKVQHHERDAALSWSRPALFLADRPDAEHRFAAYTHNAAALLEGVTSEELALPGSGAGRAAGLARLAAGTPLLYFIGHGGMDRLGTDGQLTANDIDDLASGGPGLLVAVSCLLGRYEIPGYSGLAEGLLLEDTSTVAVWAPAALTYTDQSRGIGESLLTQVGTANGARLGDLTLSALRGSSQGSLSFNLLGDPALRMGVEPPRSGEAVTPTIPSVVSEPGTEPTPTLDDGGCGCRVGAGTDDGGGIAWIVALAVLVLGRRRRLTGR